MAKNNELAMVKYKNSIIVELIKKIKNFLSDNTRSSISEVELLNLQNRYEKNEINVEELSTKQYESIVELYKKQIKQLEEEVNDKVKGINIIIV